MDKIAVTLEGSIVILECIAEDHREGLWQAAQSPEIFKWTSHIADSREDFDLWFEAGLITTQSGEKCVFTTVDRRSATVVGSTTFHDFRPGDGVIEIGSTWLSPVAWGSGANIDAKRLMMEHAFEDLGCVRVEFKTDARNQRSRAALAALPAQFEGILRKQVTLPGIGVRDSAFYSVIDEEWPAVRANLCRRLGEHLQA